MSTFRVAPDLLIDRHHRGAIVMVGTRTFALDERAIGLVERVQRGEAIGLLHAEAEIADGLVASGVLCTPGEAS
ncbi:MAG: hypothetical protein IPG50_19655 [Myxococcales bacterium]|nr:hypothetical protein [Myxococcales bacterium]